jgi:hypothetical protein
MKKQTRSEIQFIKGGNRKDSPATPIQNSERRNRGKGPPYP